MASSAALTASAALKSRIRRPSLLNKLSRPEDLLHHFPNGAYIGWSGFTGVGYPKYESFSFPESGIVLPHSSVTTESVKISITKS